MFWLTLPAVLVVKLICFYAAGHCHRSFHHISFSDLAALLRSATLATLVIMALNSRWSTNITFRWRGLLLDWGLTILVLGCLRAFMRLVREELRPRLFGGEYHKALIIGANQSGETLARHLLADHRLKYRVVGFLGSRRQPPRFDLGRHSGSRPARRHRAHRRTGRRESRPGDLRAARRRRTSPAGRRLQGGRPDAEGHSGPR